MEGFSYPCVRYTPNTYAIYNSQKTITLNGTGMCNISGTTVFWNSCKHYVVNLDNLMNDDPSVLWKVGACSFPLDFFHSDENGMCLASKDRETLIVAGTGDFMMDNNRKVSWGSMRRPHKIPAEFFDKKDAFLGFPPIYGPHDFEPRHVISWKLINTNIMIQLAPDYDNKRFIKVNGVSGIFVENTNRLYIWTLYDKKEVCVDLSKDILNLPSGVTFIDVSILKSIPNGEKWYYSHPDFESVSHNSVQGKGGHIITRNNIILFGEGNHKVDGAEYRWGGLGSKQIMFGKHEDCQKMDKRIVLVNRKAKGIHSSTPCVRARNITRKEMIRIYSESQENNKDSSSQSMLFPKFLDMEKNDQEAKNGENTCIICIENVVNCGLVCRNLYGRGAHFSYCVKCANEEMKNTSRKCAICRADKVGLMYMYNTSAS